MHQLLAIFFSLIITGVFLLSGLTFISGMISQGDNKILQGEEIVTETQGYENPDTLTAGNEETGHPASAANDDSTATFWQSNHTQADTIYSDGTQSTALFVNQTRPLVGIHVTNTSALLGDNINQIELNVRKVGEPTQAAEVGIFSANVSSTQTVNQNGSDTTAVATSSGVPQLLVANGDITINIDEGDSIGERPNTKQSILYDYPINHIEAVRLAKTGTPLGTVTIGVMDETTGLPVHVLAVVDVEDLSTSTFASFGGTSSTEHFVQLGEAIGFHFNGTGSQTSGSAATFVNATTQQAGTSLITLNNGGNTIIAERADTSSALIGDEINALEVRLLRSTVATSGTVTLGVFDASGNTLYTFCTMDAVQLTTAQTQVVCVNEDSTHTIALNNRIGVKYASGDGSNNVQVATSGSNPFDGTASYREVFTGSWTATTTSDLRFNMAKLQPKASGTFSLDFDGTNTFIPLNNNGQVFNNTSTISIFADISPDTAKVQSIISNRHIANQYGFGLSLTANNNPSFLFYPVDGSGLQNFTDSRSLTLGQFARLGVSFNGTHTIFCIDRVCQVDDNVITSKTIESNPIQYLRIGHREQAGAASERFDGNIDNLKIYTTAKTEAQQIVIQRGGIDEAGLFARIDFDEGTGAHVTDSFDDVDGTVTGGAVWENGYNVGSYVRARISNTESFDHTETDLRTTYAVYDVDTLGWTPDATRDFKMLATGITRVADNTVDTSLSTFWTNANPATINSTTGVLDYSKLIGSNYDDPLLADKWVNAPGLPPTSQSFIRTYFEEMVAHNFTVVRVPMHWEVYEANPTDFLTTVENIAIVAQEEGLKVFYDNHHWYLSSRLTNDVANQGGKSCGATGGTGFPEFIIAQYDAQIICYDTKERATSDGMIFWDDWWTNTVTYNGTDAWEDMADYMKDVVNRVDQYDSVIGYEILNEPHFWSDDSADACSSTTGALPDHYKQAKAFYTRMYNELREVTNKDIHITRETNHGGMTRDPDKEHCIFPTPGAEVFGIVYQPHHYNAGTLTQQLNTVDTILADLYADGYEVGTIPVLWGEFAIGVIQPETEDVMRTFMEGFSSRGHAWTYWKWNISPGHGGNTEGRVLIQNDLDPFPALTFIDNLLPEYYNLPLTPFSGGSGVGLTTDSIYLNFSQPLSISSVVLRHQHADFVPDGVRLYISNSTTNWGTPDETATLTASAGNQTITVNPVRVGQYLKVEPTSFTNARLWRIQTIDAGQEAPFSVIQNVTGYTVTTKKLFGTITPGALSGSFQNITRTLASETYTIAEGDFIGINYEENSGSNYIEIRIDTDAGGDFDGNATHLMYAQDNATQLFTTHDLTGRLLSATILDNPQIFGDIGTVKTITKLKIYKPDIAAIPATVSISLADTIDNQTGEPAFSAVLTGYSLNQSTGFEEINFADGDAQYISLVVEDPGSASDTRLAEYDVETITETTTIDYAMSDRAVSTWNTTTSAIYLTLVIVSFFIFAGSFKGIMKLDERFGDG